MNPSLKQQFHKNISPCSSKIVKQGHTIIRIKSIIVIGLVHLTTISYLKNVIYIYIKEILCLHFLGALIHKGKKFHWT